MRANFRVPLRFLALIIVLASSLLAAEPEIVVSGPKGERRFTRTSLTALPRAEVSISDHGTPAKFEGVELHTVLELVGAPVGEHLRGNELANYVLIEARDGYRAVFSIAELSPAFSERKVILADHRDGKLLSEAEGPFRVAVENEKRMGRCVRQVSVIRMAVAE